MRNPIGWFEIHVQDMARARAFYETVFGQTLQPLPSQGGEVMEMLAFPMQQEGYGASGALVKMAGVPSGGNSTLVYFACGDCAVEAGKVEPAGGQVYKGKTAIGPHGFIALALDTEGNMIGLHSMA